METFRIWEGVKNSIRGYDNSDYEVLEFTGEELGVWEDQYDPNGNRGLTIRVYRTVDGTILIHRYEWSRYCGEDHIAGIFEYGSLDEAAADGWRRVLENMRVLDRRTYTIEEWRRRRKRQQN